MPTRQLPEHPDLDQYRKQAKELLRAWKDAPAAVAARIRAHHPRFTNEELPAFALADAQLVIAREHGFESWPRFAAHVRAAVDDPVARVWSRAEEAVVQGDVTALDALLAEHGRELRTGTVRTSWLGGLAPDYAGPDARAVLIKEHFFASWDEMSAHLAARADEHSAAAQFERAVDATVTGDVATLERLLRARPELVRLRSPRTHHATLLHYVGANGVEGFRQRTPKNAVEVARVLLDHGAEIDARADMYGGSDTLGLVATSCHPLAAGVQNELMAFLLKRGASVGTNAGAAAWSSLINGCHANGRGAAAEFLAARAPGLDLEATAGVGRLDLVENVFAADGTLLPPATAEQLKAGFTWACEFGRAAVVDFLLDRGIAIDARLRHHGQTGLHWAALGGHVDTVRVLLRRQAPVNARDEAFNGTPLGWTLYGWEGAGAGGRDGRYHDVVRLLVEAGGTTEERWLADSSRLLGQTIAADPQMREALGNAVE